jgi:hypothetical protein
MILSLPSMSAVADISVVNTNVRTYVEKKREKKNRMNAYKG